MEAQTNDGENDMSGGGQGGNSYNGYPGNYGGGSNQYNPYSGGQFSAGGGSPMQTFGQARPYQMGQQTNNSYGGGAGGSPIGGGYPLNDGQQNYASKPMQIGQLETGNGMQNIPTAIGRLGPTYNNPGFSAGGPDPLPGQPGGSGGYIPQYPTFGGQLPTETGGKTPLEFGAPQYVPPPSTGGGSPMGGGQYQARPLQMQSPQTGGGDQFNPYGNGSGAPGGVPGGGLGGAPGGGPVAGQPFQLAPNPMANFQRPQIQDPNISQSIRNSAVGDGFSGRRDGFLYSGGQRMSPTWGSDARDQAELRNFGVNPQNFGSQYGF